MSTTKQGRLLAISVACCTLAILWPLINLLERVQSPRSVAGQTMLWQAAVSAIDPNSISSKFRPALSADGRRMLFAKSENGKVALELWQEGLGVSRLSAEDVDVIDAAISADGMHAVFLAIAKNQPTLSLVQWSEAAGVETLLERKFSGAWSVSLSADGSRAFLLPQKDARTVDLEHGDKNDEGLMLEISQGKTRGSSAIKFMTLLPQKTIAANEAAVASADGKVEVQRFKTTPRFTAQDVDGDSVSDLLLVGRTSNSLLWHALTLGGLDGPSERAVNTFSRTVTVAAGPADAIPLSGDFDGDGIADFAAFTPNFSPSSSAPFNWHVYLRERDAVKSGRSEEVRELQYYWGNGRARPVPADYDGDGRTDIAVFDPDSASWSILYSGGDFNVAKGNLAVAGYGAVVQWGLPGDMPVPGDYDGDGKAELAVVRMTDGGKSIRWLIRSNAAGSNAALYDFYFGAAGDIAIPADYDGNGRMQAAIFKPSAGAASQGEWTIREADGSEKKTAWCDYKALPLAADFDGDGRDDLGCFSADAQPHWKILPSRISERGRELFGDNGPAKSNSEWTVSNALPVSVLLRDFQYGDSQRRE